MKCANVAFSVVPTVGDGDAENWNRVWVRYGLLFCHTLGTVCCFFFSSRIYLQHTAWPVESDRPINIVFVCLSVRPSVVSLSMSGQNSTTTWDRFEDWSFVTLSSLVLASEWTINLEKFAVKSIQLCQKVATRWFCPLPLKRGYL